LEELGFVGRGRSRNRPRDAAHLYGGPYPFIQTAEVKHSTLYVTEYSQTYSEEGLAQSKLWPSGTLCITIAANIADTAILSFDACFPDSVIGFVPYEGMSDARYIKYLFDFSLQRRFKVFSQGATQDNLSEAKLLSLKLTVPDIDEQERVADILSTYDALIENNRRRIELLEQAARLLYQEWFIRFRFPGHEHIKIVDGVPEGWERTTIRDSFRLLGGYPFKSSTYREHGKYGIVTIKNVHDGEFRPECTTYVDEPPNNLEKHCYLSTGDILLSLTGNIGRTCIVFGDNYLLNQRVAVIVPNEGVPITYAYWFFKDTNTQHKLENLSYGVAQQNLSTNTLGEQEYLRPAFRILLLFDFYLRDTFNLICNLNIFKQKLKQARDLLLPRLMSGEIAI